eukprot:CAMPEP_0178392324 /NCGR_PEP_ID=MMETSP0689_2-20121128/11621_1 /TAXON_ID=160604 /ORGANISM="Amphidinium massartii, Strain CS-259" /LENGTH=1056 /DNA_ID=CAMNT_0020012897 /DNA_START=53 /DNA_END=3220 /DNA_ORIENTATION=+
MASNARELARSGVTASRRALLGPVGDRPGRFPEHRASVGFRAAIAVMLAGSLTFTDLNPDIYPWVRNAVTPLLPIITLLCVTPDLGSTTKMCVSIGFGVTVLTALGGGIAALCYVIGGCHFYSWILVIAIVLTSVILIILSNIAAVIYAPKVLMFADQTNIFWTILPLSVMLHGTNDITRMWKFTTSSMCWFGISGIIGYACAFLPCGLQALPAWRRVHSNLAAVLESLGSYTSAVSSRRSSESPLPAAVDKRRQLRHEVLRSSSHLREALKTAGLERCGGYFGQTSSVGKVQQHAEICRLAVSLQHASNNHPCSSSTIARNMYYRGPFNDGVQELSSITTETLHAAASLVADVAGHRQPPTTLIGTWDEDRVKYADPDTCRALAAECREEVEIFRQKWMEWSLGGWKQRFKEVNADFGITSSSKELIHSVPLSEVCSSTASHLGAFSAALAAAAAAEAAAELGDEVAENRSRWTCLCRPLCGGIGITAWLRIASAGPKVWKQGFDKGIAYAIRQGLALGITSALVAAFPGMWPNKGSPGFWAILTAGLCVTPVLGAAVLKSVRRLIGTVAGALAAVAVIALAQWDYHAIWVWIGLTAFFVKFFEHELQYGGFVFFLTMCIVFVPAVERPDDWGNIRDTAISRCLEIGIGVVVAGLVSIFVAPTRATAQLRSLEFEALSLSAFTTSAVSRALATAAASSGGAHKHKDGPLGPFTPLIGKELDILHEDDASSSESESDEDDHPNHQRIPRLSKLRECTWELNQSLFFGGDGQPGIGDTLSDARWEARFCSDSGYELFHGLLWFPELCCICLSDPALSTGRQCLSAVQTISRLMRQSHVLVALVGPGFGSGGDVFLSHPNVLAALGHNGEELASVVQQIAASVEPLVVPHGSRLRHAISKKLVKAKRKMHLRRNKRSGLLSDEDELEGTQESIRTKAIADARAGLEELDRRLALLLSGANLGRSKAGGGLMARSETGDIIGGSSHRIAAVLFLLQNVSDNLTDIVRRLSGEDWDDCRSPVGMRYNGNGYGWHEEEGESLDDESSSFAGLEDDDEMAES